MLTVHLTNLRFVALHGIYPEEAILGNDFEVNVDISFDDKNMDLTKLENLINYEEVFRLVQARMAQPTPLLETVATSLIDDIYGKYTFADTIRISIFKLNAPISKLRGRVGITLERVFKS